MRTMICILMVLLLTGCVSPEPSKNAIQTAITETQAAQQSSKYQPDIPTAQVTSSINNTETTPLLAYDLEKVKTKNGMTTYQVGIAIQNISDRVVESTIQYTGAQVITDDGGTFPAQLAKIIEVSGGHVSNPSITERDIYYLVPPCAVIVDVADQVVYNQSVRYLYLFEIPDNLTPTTLKVLEFPDIDLKRVYHSDQLRFGINCPESKFPLTFTTDEKIMVIFSSPRMAQNDKMGSKLTFDVVLENLDNKKNQKIFLTWRLIDPEGSMLKSWDVCDNKEGNDNINLGNNEIGPGQLINGEVCIALKSDSYYVSPIWEKVDEIRIPESQDLDGTITVEGIETTFDELRNGIELADGRKLVWYGNKRTRLIEIFEIKGVGSRVRRNLGDIYYLAVWANNHTGWATIPLP
jgi:hypothetical protein